MPPPFGKPAEIGTEPTAGWLSSLRVHAADLALHPKSEHQTQSLSPSTTEPRSSQATPQYAAVHDIDTGAGVIGLSFVVSGKPSLWQSTTLTKLLDS